MKKLTVILAALALAVTAQAAVINDGSTTANLTQVVNVVDTANYSNGVHVVTMTSDGSTLSASTYEDADPTNGAGNYDEMDDNSAKGIWYHSTTYVNTSDYSVSADFTPAADNGRHRGGVVGLYNSSAYDATLNPTGQTGIGLYIKPGSAFRIRTMRMGVATDAENEDSGLYLYDDNGDAISGSGIDFNDSGYDVNSAATFELAFAEGVVGDGFIDVTATVTQGSNSWSQTFKTDLALPSPSDHRVGYLGYAGTSPGDDVGTFDNLTYVPEPATLSLLGFGGLALLRRRRS